MDFFISPLLIIGAIVVCIYFFCFYDPSRPKQLEKSGFSRIFLNFPVLMFSHHFILLLVNQPEVKWSGPKRKFTLQQLMVNKYAVDPVNLFKITFFLEILKVEFSLFFLGLQWKD